MNIKRATLAHLLFKNLGWLGFLTVAFVPELFDNRFPRRFYAENAMQEISFAFRRSAHRQPFASRDRRPISNAIDASSITHSRLKISA